MTIALKANAAGTQGEILLNGNPVVVIDTVGIVQGALPAGAVMDFAMNAAPLGWLACDGAAVSRTTYAALFAAIGTVWGAGNGSTTFNLPDMRGYFRRGVGTNSDGTASGTFAVKQADEIRAHSHSLANTLGAFTATTGGTALSSSNVASTTGSTGGAETRPKNIAVLTCIKT